MSGGDRTADYDETKPMTESAQELQTYGAAYPFV
jgi:hypothetical protein